ncbi:unnamed protein product [Prorocentrum cordatum]|uniref:Uncharacterized protein n=1 Tax=Prorocentrum cordatum TaxID=2364126 RepID=A0ABN9XUA2_9DINO|nr:unnamed protein product [Polarella glacialis]|mmetsp:Transcript_11609/g.30900  ORF Transcript_11609/g.30900 Transcript_11609/m.30900 type:complete len:113 (-) Transcript_11609:986-1324(-)
MAADDKASATAAVSGGSEEKTSAEPKVAGASPARDSTPAPKDKKKSPQEVSQPEGTSTSTILIVVTIIVAIIGAVGGVYYWWNLPKEGELTKSTWDDATSGKTVFVKFLAPW